MYCSSCGKQVEKGDQYCRHCGQPVFRYTSVSASSPTSASAVEYKSETPESPYQTPPAPTPRPVDLTRNLTKMPRGVALVGTLSIVIAIIGGLLMNMLYTSTQKSNAEWVEANIGQPTVLMTAPVFAIATLALCVIPGLCGAAILAGHNWARWFLVVYCIPWFLALPVGTALAYLATRTLTSRESDAWFSSKRVSRGWLLLPLVVLPLAGFIAWSSWDSMVRQTQPQPTPPGGGGPVGEAVAILQSVGYPAKIGVSEEMHITGSPYPQIASRIWLGDPLRPERGEYLDAHPNFVYVAESRNSEFRSNRQTPEKILYWMFSFGVGDPTGRIDGAWVTLHPNTEKCGPGYRGSTTGMPECGLRVIGAGRISAHAVLILHNVAQEAGLLDSSHQLIVRTESGVIEKLGIFGSPWKDDDVARVLARLILCWWGDGRMQREDLKVIQRELEKY